MLKIIPYSSIISVSQIKSISAAIAVFSYTIYTSVNTADNVQGGPEKTAQNLMCYNFSTAGHRVTRFSA